MDHQLLPPIAQLTTDDRGPILIVYTYILIVNTLLFISIKIASTVLLKRRLDWDDALVSAAGILALAQSVVTERSAINGTGRFQQSLSSSELELYFKRALASNVLSIAVQCLAKISALFLIQRLSATGASKMTFRILYLVMASWFVFGLFALVFQCGTNNPWSSRTTVCGASAGLGYAVMITNILTDAVVAMLFVPMVWKLQLALASKWRISLLFGARLIVCFLTIALIVSWSTVLRDRDITRAALVPAILGQFVMNFSLLTAVAPSLYRFLNELSSGPGFGGLIDRSQYELSSYSGGQSGSRKKRSSTYVKMSDKKKPTFRPDVQDGTTFDATVSSKRRQSGLTTNSNDQGSEDMIIRHTTDWSVRTYDGK